jgi:serine/threonine-protein kinase
VKLRVRSRLGKYRILARLNEGAVGTVYAAFDTIEGVHVALKVAPPDASADALAQLRSEIRYATRLLHPNVLRLRNADEIGGRLVLAYPLGRESLADRLRRRMAVSMAVDLFEQVLEALAHAHTEGVFHGDVKPDNVILFDGGVACLADFGLARVAPRTVAASGEGTIGFMAPEQALGRPSIRSDVFAAGLLLYRLMSGDLAEWPYRWPLPRHAKVKRKLGVEGMEILRRSLEIHQRKRYASAGAMLRAFRRACG